MSGSNLPPGMAYDDMRRAGIEQEVDTSEWVQCPVCGERYDGDKWPFVICRDCHSCWEGVRDAYDKQDALDVIFLLTTKIQTLELENWNLRKGA